MCLSSQALVPSAVVKDSLACLHLLMNMGSGVTVLEENGLPIFTNLQCNIANKKPYLPSLSF